MDVISAISTRRSVRSYTDQPVSPETMDQLLRLGTMAATGNNTQPWGFVVIQDKDEIERLNQVIKADLLAHLEDYPHLQQYQKGLEDPNFSVLNHASSLVIVYGDTAAHYHVYDCTLAASNIMMAARSMGIESCWIGFAEYYFASDAFKKEYGVPDSYELVSTLTLGYPTKPVTAAPDRRPPVIFHRS
ncbi:nitroreductase family protein [Pseudoflavonifractor sp. MSJ-37]|uniref:nitroreductase family protein n=1 Tax=Pseudoflavonifractor sp. MSJ-37 TaxID=2841531 RepID=UPI001C1259E1|nr:nitroreductase family protein [Pseudoflavonifractor sp. MSJ-37]MBU5434327.1 nitroreductase family protein [Pseudoflavonifractor sp. MSJ-37]